MRLRALVLALSITPFLIACGGSSGANPPAAADSTVHTGKFTGLNISGLHYQTATQTGLTSASGEFQYLAGEQISFSLGAIELGSTQAQAEIDLISELAGTLPSTRDHILQELAALNDVTAFDEIINLATLLMALDADQNNRNGIDLADLHSRMNGVSLDFDLPMSRFLDNLAFRQVVAQYGKRIDLPYKEVILAVYDALDIQVAAPRINRIRESVSDGRVKTSVLNYGASSRLGCEHTRAGQLCSVDEDTDGTLSTIEQSILLARDSDGHIIKDDRLQGASTQTDPTYLERNIFIYTPDAAKRLSQWQLEENGVAQSRFEHTYNSFGQPLSRRGYDLVGEESLFYAHTSSYSPDNLNESSRSIPVDMVNEEEPPRALTYSYDDQTNALTEIIVDPIPLELVDQQRHAYSYPSANGLDHTINFYLDNNASPDLEHVYGYDAFGHLSTFEGTSQADGATIRQRITETYNALGQLEQSIHDVFGDGTPDWQVDYTYTDEHLIESKTVRRLQTGEEPEISSVMTLTYSLDKNPLADGLLQIMSPEFGFTATPLIGHCILDNNSAELPECEPHP